MVIPYRFQSATLDDFGSEADPAREFIARLSAVEPEEKVDYSGSWMEGVGHLQGVEPKRWEEFDLQGIDGLVIVGPVGTGKTHLAVATVKAVPEGVGRLFASALTVVQDAKDAITGDREAWPMHSFPGVLALDDLSGIRPTDFALDTLSTIIRARYDAMLPTIVTTHTGHTELSETYGAAIASRLLELGPLVKLEGGDRRRVDDA